MKRIHFDTIDSTNTWAKDHATQFPLGSFTIVTADEQTGGRGQFNRKWVSPPKCNLYVSYCFFLTEYSEILGNIPQILALSLISVIDPLGFPAMIKWPNDIILKGKKLGGILCETTPINKNLFVIVGLGLNVNMPKELLEKVDQPATSLFEASGIHHDIEAILAALTQEFKINLEELLSKGLSSFSNELGKLLISDSENYKKELIKK